MSEPGDPTACTPVTRVTPAGADWLASASRFPRSVHALWALRPGAPSVLPCGTAFDVVSSPLLYGRRLLERLWATGPGSGPAAVHRSRVLLFAAPGSADRLLALLRWEEWRETGGTGGATFAEPGEETIPPLLCHGPGDTVTVPPLAPAPRLGPAAADAAPGARPGPGSASDSRWLVAPGVRRPWLPGAEMLLWAHVRVQRDARAARSGREAERDAGRNGDGGGKRIFAPQDRDAKVYDVSRRR
ncbi:hypothetical protein DVA86_29110 [Streptomyces armeniacus]|uniref:DNA primase/polymerase bifunctional N-terminal domain-containing protein n=1 Tax=Streptomyces armeniacus TaxID=83291 RepID=A0A345Y1I0_9ACTN|nr:hypothetical protein [Streptomyces armeniacus]AXK37746.1 hypothetical protein DVA86_29110 [Streptomyces armeniacus]